jgi:large subunit ribosomal protein L16
MLMPKRTKYRKQMKGRNRGKSMRANSLAYGEFGIKAIKRQGKVWIMVFPHKPLTKRPLEVRMGKGKGPIDKWVMNIKPGRVCFEMAGVSEELARNALTLAQHKLPFKTKIVSRDSENDLF